MYCLGETEKYFEYFRVVGIPAEVLTGSFPNASHEPTLSDSLILVMPYCRQKYTFVFGKQFFFSENR
jgi:hypothetical protein